MFILFIYLDRELPCFRALNHLLLFYNWFISYMKNNTQFTIERQSENKVICDHLHRNLLENSTGITHCSTFDFGLCVL